jgi:hypothetical protein
MLIAMHTLTAGYVEISLSMCMWNGDTQEKEVLIGHQGEG